MIFGLSASATETTTVTELVGVPTPDVSDLTLGVFDLTDTGLVTDEPEVLVWLAIVTERGWVW
jgi:hypothetical protein